MARFVALENAGNGHALTLAMKERREWAHLQVNLSEGTFELNIKKCKEMNRIVQQEFGSAVSTLSAITPVAGLVAVTTGAV